MRRGASGHAVAPRSGRPAGHLSRPRAAPVEGVDEECRNVLRGGRRRNTATASRVLGPRPRHRAGARPRPYTDERGRNGHEAGVTGRRGATGAILLKQRSDVPRLFCVSKSFERILKGFPPGGQAAAGRLAATVALAARRQELRLLFGLPGGACSSAGGLARWRRPTRRAGA